MTNHNPLSTDAGTGGSSSSTDSFDGALNFHNTSNANPGNYRVVAADASWDTGTREGSDTITETADGVVAEGVVGSGDDRIYVTGLKSVEFDDNLTLTTSGGGATKETLLSYETVSVNGEQGSGSDDSGSDPTGDDPGDGPLAGLPIPELLPGIGPLSSKATTLLAIFLGLAAVSTLTG